MSSEQMKIPEAKLHYAVFVSCVLQRIKRNEPIKKTKNELVLSIISFYKEDNEETTLKEFSKNIELSVMIEIDELYDKKALGVKYPFRNMVSNAFAFIEDFSNKKKYNKETFVLSLKCDNIHLETVNDYNMFY